MRVVDLKIEDINFSSFEWKQSERASGTHICFYRGTKRSLGSISFAERKSGDVYLGKVTVNKLSGDFKFEEDDFEVAKFKVVMRLVEYLKEMHSHPKRKYYEIY